MSLINRDGLADVTFDGDSIADQVNGFEITSNTEMTRADVFANEGEVDQEPGAEQFAVLVTGFLEKDEADSVTFHPAPQNKAWVFTYTTGCTLGGNFDCPSATQGRPVNGLAYFRVTLLSKPGWSVAWDTNPS